MGVSRLSDFIDRAKLEAAMLQVDVAHFASKKPLPTVEDYATAVLALLDAETTEEWGVAMYGDLTDVITYSSREHAESVLEAHRASGYGYHRVVHRPAPSPWLPSEGGEKRG